MRQTAVEARVSLQEDGKGGRRCTVQKPGERLAAACAEDEVALMAAPEAQPVQRGQCVPGDSVALHEAPAAYSGRFGAHCSLCKLAVASRKCLGWRPKA